MGWEDLDGAEQEDRSPLATWTLSRSRSVSCSIRLGGMVRRAAADFSLPPRIVPACEHPQRQSMDTGGSTGDKDSCILPESLGMVAHCIFCWRPYHYLVGGVHTGVLQSRHSTRSLQHSKQRKCFIWLCKYPLARVHLARVEDAKKQTTAIR